MCNYLTKLGIQLLILFSLTISLNAQINQVSSSPASASSDVALNKTTIQVDNDPFNGKVNISCPLFNYTFEGILFPVSLNYVNSNGVKPDQLPSWVGNGWDLETGAGYVHRIVRSKPDEIRDFSTKIERTTIYTNGVPSTTVTKETIANTTDFSYFTNKSLLQNTQWSSSAFAMSNRGNTTSNAPYPLSASPDYTLFGYNLYPFKDLAPDEFTFSVGSISGKFYLDHNNKWIVVSNDGKLYDIKVNTGPQTVVDYTLSPPFNFRYLYTIPLIIKNFIITSTDGIEYIFGNENINAPWNQQYLEYSRSSLLMNSMDVPTPKYSGSVKPGYLDIVPNAWHITRITNKKTGSQILFNYNRLNPEIYTSANAWSPMLWNNGSTSAIIYQPLQIFPSSDANSPDYYSFSAVTGIWNRKWTLGSIIFPNGVSVKFNTSESAQLSAGQRWNFGAYDEIKNWLETNVLIKLDSIQYFDGADLTKQFDFTYQLSPSSRLQLLKVTQKRYGQAQTLDSFSYNNTIPLPGYGSRKTDHWGYYNNKDFFSSVAEPYNMTKMQQYTTFKAPDTSYVKAELLNKVFYPFGGYSEFEYEPHTYSKYNDLSGHILSTVNTIAGGVRIRNIKYYPAANQLATNTSFDYTVPGSPTTSSGVLGIGIPQYIIPETNDYSKFLANGFSPVNYNGNNVTYTNVAVKREGAGKIQYTYTNYDNGFMDGRPTANTISLYTTNLLGTIYSNKAFKRGRPTIVSTYANNGTLLRESKFKYEHDFGESGKNQIRSVYYDQYAPTTYASVTDTVYQDWLREEETNELYSGASVTKRTTYTYDTCGNIKETVQPDGKGVYIKTKYKYCYEYATGTDDISLGVAYQNQLGLKNSIVEKIVIRQNENATVANVIDATLYVYNKSSAWKKQEYKLNTLQPIAIASFQESKIQSGTFSKDAHYSSLPEIEYSRYNAYGDLLESYRKDKKPVNYIWGYDNQYQVAKIINAKSYDPVYTIQEQYKTVSIPSNPSYTFTSTGGTMTLKLLISVGYMYKLQYTLYGPSSKGGVLCASGTNTTCTSPQTETFTNMQPGTYTLVISDYESMGIPSKELSITYSGWAISVPEKREFFYEGFEEIGNASGTPFAGKKYYTGGYTVPYEKISNEVYVIDYRYLENGVWKLKTLSFANNMTLPENIIDEVRVYPKKAEMWTYTYDPMVGMTSETDPAGNIAIYDYDAFGRLSTVKDEKGNILKKICYNYAGQRVDCFAGTSLDQTPQWAPDGNLRCVTDAGGDNTGNQEREEKDINTNSQTYNQTRWVDNGQDLAACPLPIPTVRVILKKTSSGAADGILVNKATNQSFSISPISSAAASTSNGYIIYNVPLGTYTLSVSPIISSLPPGKSFRFNVNGTNWTTNNPFSTDVSIQSDFTITMSLIP
ncbi:hypothetical protein A8C56_11345 [Niabella ginsenosidivorans]|uniref:Uncharacterized protein n=1 Tax=Niabella ginsenosidivorans TaxID=1176587 RepID=A0A1A9I1T9_9BACT|nr:RHS repeat domain-containing protein [Niabella ginsenosidivorans]ANH81493.1 hypothetical protein A8C56_11345 [Niabella ginsenosidivorans]